MAEQKGLLVICDRCGATTFRKYAGRGETDGGYTTWDKFEPIADGWERVEIPLKSGHSFKTIQTCPVCSEVWKRAVTDNFMHGTTIGE